MNGAIIESLRNGIGAAHSKIENAGREIGQLQGEQALLRQQLGNLGGEMKTLASLVGDVRQTDGGSGGAPLSPNNIGLVSHLDKVMYINEIPGRRIPFDALVSIQVGANVDAKLPQSIPISQDGPFVAVLRYCVFQSSYNFNVTDGANVANFIGRSNGRFRPVHSVCDWTDSQILQPTVGIANPGTGAPIYASPSNHSGYRSMEFDGMIEFMNEGSGRFRHNNPVPSAFWMEEGNSGFQLAALDFFERGDTLQFLVTPNHVNNPAYGNVSEFLAGGIYPAVDSQYDVHEGILDQFDDQATTDPVERVPEGILIIGFHGMKILQPPGPVRMT